MVDTPSLFILVRSVEPLFFLALYKCSTLFPLPFIANCVGISVIIPRVISATTSESDTFIFLVLLLHRQRLW